MEDGGDNGVRDLSLKRWKYEFIGNWEGRKEEGRKKGRREMG